MIYTTLNAIRAQKPCTEGWEKLLSGLGKTKADDEPLGLKKILEINGIVDGIWCLEAVSGHDKEIRLFAVACARRVEHLLTDDRSRNAIEVGENFANGRATQKELFAAGAAAEAAAWDARAAWDAAKAAAAAAVRDARVSWDTAKAAAEAAACEARAAWDARASLEAGDAARAAALDAQKKDFLTFFCGE